VNSAIPRFSFRIRGLREPVAVIDDRRRARHREADVADPRDLGGVDEPANDTRRTVVGHRHLHPLAGRPPNRRENTVPLTDRTGLSAAK
jgi:hypothetical protein